MDNRSAKPHFLKNESPQFEPLEPSAPIKIGLTPSVYSNLFYDEARKTKKNASRRSYVFELTAVTFHAFYLKQHTALPSERAPPALRYPNELRRWRARLHIIEAAVVELMPLIGWRALRLYEAAMGQF